MNLEEFGPLGLWNSFNERWIQTRRAAQLFIVASLLTLALLPFFAGTVVPSGDTGLSNTFWGLLGAFGSLSIFFIWLGMWRYWAKVDTSSKSSKRIWFLVMLVGFWYGSCLYCWCVYVPRVFGDRKVITQESLPATRKIGVFGKILLVGWLFYFLFVGLIFVFPKHLAPSIAVAHVASLMLLLTSFGYAVVWLFRQGVLGK